MEATKQRSLIQPHQPEQTFLVNDNQIARCSHEINTMDGTSDIVDDETSMHYETEKQTSVTPHYQPEPFSDEPNRSPRFRKPTKHYGDPIPTDLLGKGRRMR